MAKLIRHNYITTKGEKKLNCYSTIIPKDVVEKTDIKETDKIRVYSKDNKIIIEKVK